MKSKTAVLVALSVLSFISGAVVQYSQREDSPIDFLFLGVAAFLTFYWYYLDTEERGYRRTPLLNVGVIGFALLALPYYFFRSRGAKGGFIAIGLLIFTFLGSAMFTVAGQYAAYYLLQN